MPPLRLYFARRLKLEFHGSRITSDTVRHWSLPTLRERLIKVVRHGRYVTFQIAEVAIPRGLFADILRRIDWLRRKPVPA